MPQTPHIGRHFTGSETVRDIVIGMADGLTVPFALAAGLSGAIETTSIIVTAGLAEIAAGSIAMGLGGYMAAKSDAEHYDSERAREVMEVSEKAEIEAAEVAEVFRSYGLTTEESTLIVDALRKRPQAWVDFMMRFELGLEKPNPRRAVQCRNDCGSLHRRRLYPTRSVRRSLNRQRRSDCIGNHYSYRAGAFWLHQRPLYRRATAP